MGERGFSNKDKLVFKKLNFASGLIFFFNVFLALMIITGAGFLAESDFGKVGLFFGFGMLTLAVILRVLGKW